MKRIIVIALLLSVAVAAFFYVGPEKLAFWMISRCIVCGSDLVPVSSINDNLEKSSKNISVWNRSFCVNPFFDERSLICPNDYYAYSAQLHTWMLASEDRGVFTCRLDKAIYEFPLPAKNKIKSLVVYSQEFVKEKRSESISFWFMNDDSMLESLRDYSKKHKLDLRADRERLKGQTSVTAIKECNLSEVGNRP